MARRKLTIAVTGLNNTDNPGPGIPVIRAIRESGAFDARVIGLAYENMEPGIYLRELVDKSYQVPYPSEGSNALMERLEYIHSLEKIDVLIPNFDAELYTFMKANGKLESMGIRAFLPDLKQFEERNKLNLIDFGKKNDILVPRGKAISKYEEISDVPDEFDFPVMVKGRFYDAYIAYNTDQIRAHFNKISAKWGLPIIIQEFIHGTEVNVVALGDGKGQTIAAVPMRKQYITDKGKAWSGITIDNPKLVELTKRVIKSTRWKGGMEMELIKTINNDLYLIEINPRIPAWVYLAVSSGQNIPEALVKLALGEEVTPYTGYKTGTMFIRYSYDLICHISDFEKISTTGEY